MEDKKMCEKCGCMHHKIVPICIVLIGLAFLAGQMGWATMGFVSVAWPIFLIVIGATKMVKCGCCCKG